jgi:hypothetical protein
MRPQISIRPLIGVPNHNQTLVEPPPSNPTQHNQTIVRKPYVWPQHNQTIAPIARPQHNQTIVRVARG